MEKPKSVKVLVQTHENLFKANNKGSQNDVNDVAMVSSLLTLDRFHKFLFVISIADFQEVNTGSVILTKP